MANLEMKMSVEATADEAWDVLGTGFGTMCEWDSGMASSTLEGELGVGAVRHCVSAKSFGPFKPGTVKERLVEFDPEARVFAYEAFEGLPGFVRSAGNRWTIQADGEHCIIRFDATLQLRGVMRFAWPLMRRMMKRDLSRWLEDLRHRIEEGTPRTQLA